VSLEASPRIDPVHGENLETVSRRVADPGANPIDAVGGEILETRALRSPTLARACLSGPKACSRVARALRRRHDARTCEDRHVPEVQDDGLSFAEETPATLVASRSRICGSRLWRNALARSASSMIALAVSTPFKSVTLLRVVIAHGESEDPLI
jgi:hypothetical protein